MRFWKTLLAVLIASVPLKIDASFAQGTFLKPQPPGPTEPERKKKSHAKPQAHQSPPGASEASSGGAQSVPAAAEEIRGSLDRVDGTTLIVRGRRLLLTSIAPKPNTDLSNALIAWVNRNGGQVDCKQMNGERDPRRGYLCLVGGLDVSRALVINGYALPNGHYDDVYKIIQTRDAFITNNTDPVFTKFRNGEIVLDCHSPISCMPKFLFGGWKENNRLYDNRDWVGLIKNVDRIGFQVDINYYYLAYAAEDLGFLRASAIYLRRAVELSESTNPLDHCDNTEAATCNGVDIRGYARETLGLLQKYSVYEF